MNYFDGQLAHFHYADGQIIHNSIWRNRYNNWDLEAASPSVTYGNNGSF